jgi:steroid delta-isomerase-like uncharacterized protein
MPVKENIELMRRWFHEVWNEGKIETVRELFAPDGRAVGHYGERSEIHGPDEFVPFVHRIRGAFPDVKLTIDDAFGARDKVVIRWSAAMTHSGESMGPASNKPVHVTGITIARIAKGKIVEGWDNWDQLGMLEQIGAYKRIQASGHCRFAEKRMSSD